jgi:hypothetical protein
LALFITQREWIDPEPVIEGMGDKDPVNAFLFGAGKLADSANPGHGSVPPNLLSIDYFLKDVKIKYGIFSAFLLSRNGAVGALFSIDPPSAYVIVI